MKKSFRPKVHQAQDVVSCYPLRLLELILVSGQLREVLNGVDLGTVKVCQWLEPRILCFLPN